MPGPARPAHRLRGRLPGRARPVRLPALLAARQRHLLAQGGPGRRRSARSPRPTARSSGSCTWPAGWRRSSSDHAVIVMSDHSQTTRRGRASTWPTPSPTRACSSPPTRRRPRRSSRSARPRARPWSTCSTRAAATSWCAGAVATLRGIDGVDLVATRENGEAVRSQPRAASCASPGGDRRPRGDAWRVEGERGRARTWTAATRLPGRARTGSGRRSSARTRATCWPPRSSATSSSTGAAPTTWAAAATARCTAATPRACSCSAAWKPAEQTAVGADRRHRTCARPLRCTVDAMTEELDLVVARRTSPGSRAGARGPQEVEELAAARQVLHRRRVGLRRQPVRLRLRLRGARRPPPDRRDRAPSSWRWRTTSGGTAIGPSGAGAGRAGVQAAALLRGQRRGLPVRRWACSSCW